MAMLEDVKDLTLERLNEITQAWAEQEYHNHRHDEIKTTPLRRFLDAPQVGRDCPDTKTLRQAFRCTVKRKQRRSDGTITLDGKRFEIPNRYRHLEQPSVRYARWDLSAVELIDPHTFSSLGPLYPLDKSANAEGRRRALQSAQENLQPAHGNQPSSRDEPPPLLRKCLADYAATGRPPAYLPQPDSQEKS
jgi:hypothetical protein